MSAVYWTESFFGDALAASGVPRQEFYLATKTGFNLDPDRIVDAFGAQLR